MEQIESQVCDLEQMVPEKEETAYLSQYASPSYSQSEARSPDSAGSNYESGQSDPKSPETLYSSNQSMELPLFNAEQNDNVTTSTKVELKGQTSEEEIPESRTEVDNEFALPSVKNLRSKFNADLSSEGGSSVKRVRSDSF